MIQTDVKARRGRNLILNIFHICTYILTYIEIVIKKFEQFRFSGDLKSSMPFLQNFCLSFIRRLPISITDKQIIFNPHFSFNKLVACKTLQTVFATRNCQTQIQSSYKPEKYIKNAVQKRYFFAEQGNLLWAGATHFMAYQPFMRERWEKFITTIFDHQRNLQIKSPCENVSLFVLL